MVLPKDWTFMIKSRANREIRTTSDMSETRSGTSLFSAEVHRDRRTVTLRPLWPGNDFSANIKLKENILA
jgi:hypothetical protein